MHINDQQLTAAEIFALAMPTKFVRDMSDPNVNYIVPPTVKRMRETGVAKLTIEIRGSKVLFAMEPEKTND